MEESDRDSDDVGVEGFVVGDAESTSSCKTSRSFLIELSDGL